MRRLLGARTPAGSDGPIPLGKAIQGLISALGIDGRLLEHRAVLLWEEVVKEVAGEEVSRRTRAEGLRRGELLVSVPEDAWRHRLLFERERIRQGLNRAVGREVIRSIRFGK